MKFELMLATRHLISRRGRSVSLVSMLAVGGVALGVAALIGGASITSGFERAFQEKLLGVTSHLLVQPHSHAVYDIEAIEERLSKIPGVKGVSPTSHYKAMFVGSGGTRGGRIKAIDPDRVKPVLSLDEYLIEGEINALKVKRPRLNDDGSTPVIIGALLAEQLNLKQGQLFTALSGENLASMRKQEGPSGWRGRERGPSRFMLRVAGIFQSGYEEYDARVVFMDLRESERIFDMIVPARNFEVALDDVSRSDELAAQVELAFKWGEGDPLDWAASLSEDPLRATRIARRARDEFSVYTSYEQHSMIYSQLIYQRIAILVVLSVMLILASCNVSSMMMMMTLERTPEIAILKTMGADDRQIKRIFQLEGLGVAIVGSLIGAAVGFVFCEWILGRGVSIDPKVYGIDRFPVEFIWRDYVLAIFGSILILLIAVTIPARRGSKLSASEGLRGDQLDLPR